MYDARGICGEAIARLSARPQACARQIATSLGVDRHTLGAALREVTGLSYAELEPVAAPARKPRRRREPRQYDYRLGPGGCGLSSGQRQRLALTRALLRDPAVLILDEATTNVDQETERAIMEPLRVSRRGRTTLLITHRPSLAAHADRVVAINAGRVDTVPATAAGVAGA